MKNKKYLLFTKPELVFTLLILLAVFVLSFFNMLKAQVLARDIQRKNDLKHIATALGDYLKDGNPYPADFEGEIKACLKDNAFLPCEWGKDSLESTKSAYIKPLPEDPLAPGGKYKYIYKSNTRDFHLYTALERKDDDEFDEGLFARGIMCGDFVCNFGLTSSNDFPTSKLLPQNTK